ncbi:hypothetical protein BU25DRAFT_346330, partial [Macroventuria anomochaeta]
ATVRNGVVAIEVRPEWVKHFMHNALLEEHYNHFRRALNGSWKEAEEKTVCLDDVECSTSTSLFLEWLYSQQYPKGHRFGAGRSNRTKQVSRFKACAFGDRFLVPAFRAASESALIDRIIVANRSPYYDAIIYAYEHLPSDSPVFQALIDAHYHGFAEDSDTEKNGELELRSQHPHSFLVEAMLRYMRLQSSMSRKKHLDRCNYHEHASDDERGDKCQVPRIDDFD